MPTVSRNGLGQQNLRRFFKLFLKNNLFLPSNYLRFLSTHAGQQYQNVFSTKSNTTRTYVPTYKLKIVFLFTNKDVFVITVKYFTPSVSTDVKKQP